MKRWILTALVIAGAGLMIAVCTARAAAPVAEQKVSFNRDIRPILSDNCYRCHGPDVKARDSGLRLDTREGLLGEREFKPRTVVPGKSGESHLVWRITVEEARMPPPQSGRHLTPRQIELLKRWIDQGAEWQGHWSFIKAERPPLPAVKNVAWASSPIDRFILARLEEEGLNPAPAADRITLIRRVTLDLTGLPPTPAEVEAFLADSAADAYEKVVERLLSSPRYGEHLARYWLDLARFGDTHGLHDDDERAVWLYRDYVINAFNGNKPFDQFVREQVAGDLLPGATVEQRIATGFNRNNVSTDEAGSIDQELLIRTAIDRTDTMGTVFMGLTLGCAVCHDHRFDPISQKEFYQLLAFFAAAADGAKTGRALAPPPLLRLPTPEQEAEQTALAQRSAQVRADIAAILAKIDTQDAEKAQQEWEFREKGQSKSTIPVSERNIVNNVPGDQRTDLQKKLVRDYFLEWIYPPVQADLKKLPAALRELETRQKDLLAAIPVTMVMADLPTPRPTHVLIRGDYARQGEQVQPGVPATFPPLAKDMPPNRLGLARWLTDPSHPLTARVAVNRFWQQYFGRGIVKTSEDFGVQGEWPTHPELLDWLAIEFIESSWDVKKLQKRIVTSATYRQSSDVKAEQLQADPENQLLARGPRFRLDAETIRDAALFASGLLHEQVGGRSVKPYQPPGVWGLVRDTSTTHEYKRDSGAALYRRGIYTFWKRQAPLPSLMAFDAPTRETCVARRQRTNTPLQALNLMNDEQYVEAARHLAEKMIAAGNTPAERLAHGFRLATARKPNERELQVLLRFLQRQRMHYLAHKDEANQLLAVGESKRNTTLDPAEHAALMMMANLILNLDETITKE